MTTPHTIIIRCDKGRWVCEPQPPLPPLQAFVTGGWRQVAELRFLFGAAERFEADDYAKFVEQFGEPPATSV